MRHAAHGAAQRRAPGFAEYRTTLDVVAGEPRDLGTIALTPAAGVLELASRPGGANVTASTCTPLPASRQPLALACHA